MNDCDVGFDGVLHSCLEVVSARTGRKILSLSEDAAIRLESYGWPGGVKELRRVLKGAVLRSRNGQITGMDLPRWVCGNPAF